MRRMIQILAVSLACCFITGIPVHASEPEDVWSHNQKLSAQWVNWRPASWEQDADVHALAVRLLDEAESRAAAPRRIYDWVRGNIAYDWDALERETYSALLPSEILRERKAVCEGIANLTQALFLEAGIPCIKVWGAAAAEETGWNGSGLDLDRANHTWNEFYMDGRWISLDCTMDILSGADNYFDPGEILFARTHKRLRRGDGAPSDIPSAWAVPEIKYGVDNGLIPLEWLAGYHGAMTAAEWSALSGLDEGRDIPLTRRAAAASLPPLPETAAAQPPYLDTENCSAEERRILAALYASGVMTGCDGRFYPDEPLTRQAAIAIVSRLHRYMEG